MEKKGRFNCRTLCTVAVAHADQIIGEGDENRRDIPDYVLP